MLLLIFFLIMRKKGFFLKKYTHVKATVQKPYLFYDQNQLNSIPYLWPKRLENHTLWGRTYLYSPYKGVPPPPPGNSKISFCLFKHFMWTSGDDSSVVIEFTPLRKTSVKLTFLTKNTKHLGESIAHDSSPLIEFTPLWKTRVSNYPLWLKIS